MGPGPLVEAGSLSAKARTDLLRVARAAIDTGLDDRRLLPDPAEFEPLLQEYRASFVTLHLEGLLRGCIGTLEARHPLVVDVASNAWCAASRDPRFAPVERHEFEQLDVHISVLTPPESVIVKDEADLLAQLRPGIDGLILEEGHRRGTFLPSVWEQLPEPRDFLRHLKRKAGMPDDYWSGAVRISRYTTESFS